MSDCCVAILTNGGAAFGLGHVRRCLNLAQALRRDFDVEVTFILNEDEFTQELVRDKGFDVIGVTSPRDAEQTQKILKNLGATSLITDSYQLDTEYLSSLRGYVPLLVAIDDLADKHFPVDVIVNGAANASPAIYSALPDTRFLLGPSYMLLPNEFSEVLRREFRESIGRVLITVGGSDPLELTPRLMDWVHKVLDKAALDVVVGPFFQNVEAIEQMAEQLPVKVKLHIAPDDMRTLMLQADIAVTGGGQTTYELAATATPSIAVCIADNQRNSLKGLEREGTLLYAGDVNESDLAENLTSALKLIAHDLEKRRNLAERGRQVVDGLGAHRVASVIVEECRRR